jgi:PKD repeat protein
VILAIFMASIIVIGGVSLTQPLKVSEVVKPEEIFVVGSEKIPEAATVSIALEAAFVERFPLDVVLVVDRSATMDIKLVRKIGKEVISWLGEKDRAALVSFATKARLDVELTFDKEAVKEELDELKNVGKTALGEGIALANYLLEEGRPEAILVEIVITDGKTNIGRNPLTPAEEAAKEGITIFTIGIGMFVNEAVLQKIATLTGGEFFKGFDRGVLNEIFDKTLHSVVGEEITVTKTLPQHINFNPLVNPPLLTENPDGTTTLRWHIEKLLIGERWTASFIISSNKIGTFQIPTLVAYTDIHRERVTFEITPPTLKVKEPNRPPKADFEFSPPQPRAVDTVYFKDLSTDPDGEIVSWSWDFGDGTTSKEQNPTHRYGIDGTFVVKLTVTDNEGDTNTTTKEITVFTEKVTVSRSINTFLPTDVTLASQTFQVVVEITANKDLYGLGLDENLPEGWVITTIDNVGAVFREDKAQWVFLEVIPAGTSKRIIYEVTVPEGQPIGVYTIKGAVSSASPAFELTVAGEGEIEIAEALPVRWVISRWDVEKDEINLKLPNKISFDQIQLAVAWWLEGKTVPYTKEKIIDFKMIQELVAYWLTDTPVDKPLP